MAKKKKDFKLNAKNMVTIGLAVAIGLGVSAGVSQLLKSGDKPAASDIKGLVITRENFMGNCTKAFLEESKGVGTQKQGDDYCGCTYDRGVDRFGAEEFTKMNIDLGSSNELSPEFNDLVNECISYMQQQG